MLTANLNTILINQVDFKILVIKINSLKGKNGDKSNSMKNISYRTLRNSQYKNKKSI